MDNEKTVEDKVEDWMYILEKNTSNYTCEEKILSFVKVVLRHIKTKELSDETYYRKKFAKEVMDKIENLKYFATRVPGFPYTLVVELDDIKKVLEEAYERG